jgi:hypothetical protein
MMKPTDQFDQYKTYENDFTSGLDLYLCWTISCFSVFSVARVQHVILPIITK